MNLARFLVPLYYVFLVTMMVVGPLVYPVAHIFMLGLCMGLYFGVAVSHAVKMGLSTNCALNGLRRRNDMLFSESVDLTWQHVIVIPNYKEPRELLESTLAELGSHSYAGHHYHIIMAMEEAEDSGLQQKIDHIQRSFKDTFKSLHFTVHPKGVKGELAGKGSNVNYAVRQLREIFNDSDLDRLFLTVIDADTIVPHEYFWQLENAIFASTRPTTKKPKKDARIRDPESEFPEDGGESDGQEILMGELGDSDSGWLESDSANPVIFAPYIIFGSNANEVPAAVRVSDILWSCMVLQNLSNPQGVIFPCSAYSLSYSFAEEIDFWDPGSEAIGEDMHMMIKAFRKAGARAEPVFVPMVSSNVQSPRGYFATLWARFLQARRHHLGISDVGYAAGSARASVARRLIMFFHVLEAHILPASIGLVGTLGMPLYEGLRWYSGGLTQTPMMEMQLMAVRTLGILTMVPLISIIMTYERLHTELAAEYKSMRPRKYYNVLDYIWLPVSVMIYTVIPAILSAFERMFRSHVKYTTAEKVVSPNQ